MTGPALDWQDILNLTHPEAAPLLFPRAATDATSVAGPQALPQPSPDQSTIGPYSPLRNAGRAALAGLKGAFTNSPPAQAARMLAQPARDLLNDRPGMAAINALLLPAMFAAPEGEGLARAVLEHSGGATLDPATLAPMKSTGFAVADPAFTRSFSPENQEAAVREWANSPALQQRLKKAGAHVGTWRDPETGVLEANVSDVVPERGAALRLGAARQQKAIGHLVNGEYQGDVNLPQPVTPSDRLPAASPDAVMARLRPYEYPNHDFRTPAEKVLQPREPDPALLEAHGIPAPGPSMPGQQRALPSQAQDVQAELGYNHEPMPMERVLQAAVRDFNRGKPGATFAAPTHAEAIEQAIGAGLSSRTLSRAYGMSDANRIGFVTSTGRFVNRSEAYQLADRAQQLSETAEPTYGLLHTQLASKDPFARFPTPGAIWGGKMPAGPTPASTLPADELTPTSWALAHFTQGTRSQARWLNNIRSVNPALSQALEAQPDLAKKLYSRATEHRAFVNGMPSTEQAIADARGPAGDPLANWYRGWMPTLKAAGIPDKTAKMLTDFRSILSAQASPESEMDMSLRAWDAAEHGEKITPGLLGNSGARTEKVRLAAQGEPWAEQTGILPVEPKTAPYNLANRGFTQTGAVDRHMMKYYTGTAEGLTPAQKQILQARMTHDAHVAGMGVDEFQARIWGHQTGYGLGKGRAVGGAGGIAEGSEGVAAQPPEYWLKQHLASGRFDRLLTKYPGLQALAEEGAMQGEETPGSGLFEH